MTISGPELTTDELREGLRAALAIPRWVDDVVASAPFGSLDELLEVAAHAATPLSETEIDQALSEHPRIGERHPGRGRSAEFSAAEQAASAAADKGPTDELAAANRAYEERFGRVFLVRAAGRTRPEIHAELERRLALDPATELAEVAQALREIALLRLPQLFGHLDHHSGYDESEAAR